MKSNIQLVMMCLSLALLINAKSHAQRRIGKDTRSMTSAAFKDAEKLKKTTLLVALDDENSEVSKKLIKEMETYWKFNTFKFIKATEINTYQVDPKYSILMLAKYMTAKQADGYAYSIILGDKKNKTSKSGTMSARPIASVPLPDTWNRKTGATLIDYSYLITFFVQNLQEQAIQGYEKKVHKTYKYKNALYYDEGFKEIKDMTVLISKAGLNKDFKKKYFVKNFGLKDEQVMIVEKEDIEMALQKQDEKVAIVYDFSFKSGSIYSIKGAHQMAYGSSANMLGYKIYYYSATAVGSATALYLYKRQKDNTSE